MRFSGKVALITGAARGMGANHALGFAKEGADIIALDIARDIPGVIYELGTKADLDQVVSEIKGLGRRAIGVIADVRKSSEVKAAVEKGIAEFGKIDILVNNAGVVHESPLIEMQEAQIDALIDVNFKGMVYCCKHVIPYMAKQKHGKIINISSCAGLQATAIVSVYSATKYAVRGLTEALACELSHYNINVNAVCPGAIFTTMTEKHTKKKYLGKDPKDIYTEMIKEHYFRREITKQDVTNAVLFLASDEASNITSHMLPVSAALEKKSPFPEAYFRVQ